MLYFVYVYFLFFVVMFSFNIRIVMGVRLITTRDHKGPQGTPQGTTKDHNGPQGTSRDKIEVTCGIIKCKLYGN